MLFSDALLMTSDGFRPARPPGPAIGPRLPAGLPATVVLKTHVQKISHRLRGGIVVTPLMLSGAHDGTASVSGVAHLKADDIVSNRMPIRIDEGKRRKDRNAMLSPQPDDGAVRPGIRAVTRSRSVERYSARD